MAQRRSKSRSETKGLGEKELVAKVKELEEHLLHLRMQWRTGQLASTAMMGLARKEMARTKTALQQKQTQPVAKV